MNYTEKIQKLCDRLEETNFALFDGDRKDALNTIETAVMSVPKYANIVIQEQIMTKLWRSMCEPEDYRANYQNIDMTRKIYHDSTMAQMGMLNRFSKQLDLPPFMDVDTNDRYAVAEEIGAFISEVYYEGQSRTFDEITYGKTEDYDTNKFHEHIADAMKSAQNDNAPHRNINPDIITTTPAKSDSGLEI